MKKIFNLTQHAASQEQIEAGVIDLPPADQKIVRDALTFDNVPDSRDMYLRADLIAALALRLGAHTVMIGGAPFFMGFLEAALRQYKIVPLYAFSRREAVEIDGVKKSVFKHLGWVPAGSNTVTPTPETKNLSPALFAGAPQPGASVTMNTVGEVQYHDPEIKLFQQLLLKTLS